MSKREWNSTGKGNYSKIDRELHNRERNILINEVQHDRKYRVIHKSLRDFRTRLRNNQDRHGRKEHINR